MPPDWSLLVKEISRKSIHMAGFLIPVAYYFFIPRVPLLLVLGAAVAVAAVLELIRTSGSPIIPKILLRRHEEKGMPGGYFFAIVSSFLAVLLFEKNVAVAAMLFLTLGDGITGLAGALLTMLVGRKEADKRDYDNKIQSLPGEVSYAVGHPKSPVLMAVMFIVCGLAGMALYPALTPASIVVGAIGAVIADAFPWRFFGFVVDDNLSIPLLSGALMTLALML